MELNRLLSNRAVICRRLFRLLVTRLWLWCVELFSYHLGGNFKMSNRYRAVFAAALTLAITLNVTLAVADDTPSVPLKAKPVADVPFFFLNDNRITYAYQFAATNPGFTNNTDKQVYAFTHFDVWSYGTNFLNVLLAKSGHADPASPCSTAFQGCAGAIEFYGILRSTFGLNEIFNTHAFTVGPLHNVSFVVGADGETENDIVAPNKKAVVAGLQFAFDLPYRGFFNVNPLYYKEWNHNAFLTVPGLNPDGNVDFRGRWAVEVNYYMDLGFLPANLQYFAISGRAGWYGPKGTGVRIPGIVNTKTELNSEPIRLTFDASKLAWGGKYSHFVDVWVAYRYWQNKFGLDHQVAPACVNVTGSCTESALYSGITVKF